MNGGTISDTTSEGERSRLSRRHRSRDRVAHARGASPSSSPTRPGQLFALHAVEAAALSPPTATEQEGANLSSMGTLGPPNQLPTGSSGSCAAARGFSSGSAAAGPHGTDRDHAESAGFGRSGSAAADRTLRGSNGSAVASSSLLVHDGHASMNGGGLQQQQQHHATPTRMNAVNAWTQNQLRQQAPEVVTQTQTATMESHVGLRATHGTPSTRTRRATRTAS